MREKIIENQKAGQKPATENPGTMYEANITKSALITRENKPRVRIFTGSVNRKITGLIKTLMRASTTASTRAPRGVTLTPGIRYADIPITIAETIQCNIFICLKFY